MGIHPVPVDYDIYLLFTSSGNFYFGNPLKLFKCRRYHPVGYPVEFRKVRRSLWSNCSYCENRKLSGVLSSHNHLIYIRVCGNGVDRLLNINKGDIHIGVPVKCYTGDKVSGSGYLVDRPDTAYREKHPFDPLSVKTFHLGRRPVTRFY